MAEVWRPIPSKPGFEASSLGRVRSWTGRILAQAPHIGRYRRVTLCAPKSRYKDKQLVHRLVCEAFHGPAPSPDHVAAHANDIGHDNRPDNLRWATHRENVADLIRNGRMHIGGRAYA